MVWGGYTQHPVSAGAHQWGLGHPTIKTQDQDIMSSKGWVMRKREQFELFAKTMDDSSRNVSVSTPVVNVEKQEQKQSSTLLPTNNKIESVEKVAWID